MTSLDRKKVVDRVRHLLMAAGDFRHIEVRCQGAHIVIGTASSLVARLTELGQDTFGLSFRAHKGGWEPMLLVDTLDEIVSDMTAAIESPSAGSAASLPPAQLALDSCA